jgi:hypothetical protein
VCTYLTETVDLTDSSGKVNGSWMPVTTASVYFDHPVHAPREHTLNLDFLNPSRGPSARVAVELSRESAQALRAALDVVLADAPERT